MSASYQHLPNQDLPNYVKALDNTVQEKLFAVSQDRSGASQDVTKIII